MFYLNKYIIPVLILFTLLMSIYYITGNPGVKLRPVSIPTVNHLLHQGPLRLLNISSFRYVLLNEEPCQENSVIFIITSYFGNTDVRKSIREAFNVEKDTQLNIRTVFLLGVAPNDKYTTQNAVEQENLKFKDIIQGGFVEAYRNLTYKHIMGLKWASTYCSEAKYVIKMDDDTVVNLQRLEDILNSLKLVNTPKFIAGYKLTKMKPIRDSSNKWFVTLDEYPGNSYPTFLSGWFYITTPTIAKEIATLANYKRYFWIDDLFVTGILAHDLKVLLVDLSRYFVANSEFMQCCLQDFDKGIDCDKYVGPNGGDKGMIAKLNLKARECYVGGSCLKGRRPLNETCVAWKKVNLDRGDPVIKKIKLCLCVLLYCFVASIETKILFSFSVQFIKILHPHFVNAFPIHSRFWIGPMLILD